MSVTVEVPFESIKEATSQMEGIVQRIYQNRRMQIAEAFVEVVTPFVPEKTGALRSSAEISADGRNVTWHAENPNNGYPYGDRQYEDTTYAHNFPQTDHWDQEAIWYEGDNFFKKCAEILNK